MIISESIVHQYGIQNLGYYNFVHNYQQRLSQASSVVSGEFILFVHNAYLAKSQLITWMYVYFKTFPCILRNFCILSKQEEILYHIIQRPLPVHVFYSFKNKQEPA